MLVEIPFSVSFHIFLQVQLCGVVNLRSFQHSCVNPEKKTYDGRGLGTWEGSPQCDLWWAPLSTHYLAVNPLSLSTYYLDVNPFIKCYTKFESFFKIWAIFWYFNRAILHFCWIITLICQASQCNEHCSMSRLLQYCLQIIDLEGCTLCSGDHRPKIAVFQVMEGAGGR